MSEATGGVYIYIGGKMRELKFGASAIMLVDERLGEGVAFRGVGARGVMVLVWAGLLHQDEKLALKKVMSWFDAVPIQERKKFFQEVTRAAQEAYLNYFGGEEVFEDDEGNDESSGDDEVT